MSSLPLWLGDVPEYEVVNGNMQITVGEFALAMPINVFLVGSAKGRAAVVKWQRKGSQGAKVIPLRINPKFERVCDSAGSDSGQH